MYSLIAAMAVVAAAALGAVVIATVLSWERGGDADA